MCNQEISAQGVWNVVQNVIEKIKDIEKCKIELLDKNALKEDIETPVLFQEQNAIYLYMQGKDRPKGKNKKRELKLTVSYTGWTLRSGNKNEHGVVDKTVCASFKNSKYFKKLSQATIAEKI